MTLHVQCLYSQLEFLIDSTYNKQTDTMYALFSLTQLMFLFHVSALNAIYLVLAGMLLEPVKYGPLPLPLTVTMQS